MFTTYVVQPIFNLLVLIYAILPGHNFGVAIIIFTVIIRMALWPLLKKQLHQTKMMRKLQPELKKIKQETKGDRQKESMMTMALYKERGVNPFSSIGMMIIQMPILIALYVGLRKVIDDPDQLIKFAYPALQNLPWMQHLADNIHAFDHTLFGVVDLSKAALSKSGIYWPAMVLVAASAITQYYQSKQLLVTDKNARGLKAILKDAGNGKQADQSEVNAAVGRTTRYFIPVMVFFFTVQLASALSLYWFVSGLVAFIQQTIVLREDETELEELAEGKNKKPSKDTAVIPEAEIVKDETEAKKEPKKTRSKSKKGKKKRRRK